MAIEKTTKAHYAAYRVISKAKRARLGFVQARTPRNSEVGVCQNGFFRHGEDRFDPLSTSNQLLEDL